MDAIETRATTIREQLRLFPAPPVEVQPHVDLEPAPQELVREWCRQLRMMGPDELDAIEKLTNAHRKPLFELRGAIAHRRRQLGG